MADSLETQVVLSVRDTLRTMAAASGGYATIPPPRIELGWKRPNPMTRATLLVHDASGTRAERIMHTPPQWMHHIRFGVLCLAHGQAEDGRVRALLNLTADVRRRLLRQDKTLGGLVDYVEEIEADETDEGTLGSVGEALLDFVAHATTEEDPDAV